MMNKDELIFEIEVPDFISKVKISNSRKPIYYEKGNAKTPVPKTKSKHIPLKFDWKLHKIGSKIKNLLTDVKTQQPLIKNSRVAGTAKYLPVKGNLFYSGFSHYSQRSAVINAIKDNFRSHFAGKQAKEFPIRLEFIIYDILTVVQGTNGLNKTQDIDNLFFAYVKASQDLMTQMSIIPDDNLLYIRKVSYEFIENKDKRLLIKAYKY